MITTPIKEISLNRWHLPLTILHAAACLLILAATAPTIHAALWTPSNIVTAAWYDASDTDSVMESGGAVSNWMDKSGNDYHLSQGTAAYQPTSGVSTVNGLNVLDFYGDKLFNSTSYMGSQPLSIAALVTVVDVSENRIHYLLAPKNSDTGLKITQEASLRYWSFPGVGSSYLSSDNEPVVLSCLANGASSEIRAYGDDADTGDAGTAAWGGQGLAIGQRGTDTRVYYSLRGSIGEIIISSEVWSTETRQYVEGYLAWKWGQEGKLPADHPHKSKPPYIYASGTVIIIK